MPDKDDIQGLVKTGFESEKLPLIPLKFACYLLLRIDQTGPAAAWLRQLPVVTVADLEASKTKSLQLNRIIQVGFTVEGLRKLALPETLVSQFSDEFQSGMAAEPSRSRRLGDVHENAPERWDWGWRKEEHIHVLLMLFWHGDESWADGVKTEALANGMHCFRRLETSDLGGLEPFGFRDGISQPKIAWDKEVKISQGLETEFRKETALGEFVLGYKNEYGLYTRRPLLSGATGELPHFEDEKGASVGDLGKNGTYLVFRQLSQDVYGFWKYLQEQAQGARKSPVELAELMVGRHFESGYPLVSPNEDFTYDNADPRAEMCPFGAHIRRANPRTADLPSRPANFLTKIWPVSLLIKAWQSLGLGQHGPREDLLASARFHRILRRGREYGTMVKPGEAVENEPEMRSPESNETGHGINFICLNANIARQFEFVQNSWLSSSTFNGLQESDPLLGSRATIAGCPVTSDFTYHGGGDVREKLRNLPQFVRVVGGAYFFLPGIKALKYITKAASEQTTQI